MAERNDDTEAQSYREEQDRSGTPDDPPERQAKAPVVPPSSASASGDHHVVPHEWVDAGRTDGDLREVY